MSSAPEHSGRSLPFRRLALLCAALLSCTTVRTPVSTIPPDVPADVDGPVSQLELWVESNRPLTPAESEEFRREARTALVSALADRAQPNGGELVVIRAQGITRTREHRRDQATATAGMVVAAVVVVAAVIVALVAGGKSSGKAKGTPGRATAAAPGGRAGAPRTALGGARPPRTSGSAPLPPTPRAQPWHGHSHPGPAVGVELGLGWTVPLVPEAPPPLEIRELPPRAPPPAPGGEPAQPEAPSQATHFPLPPPELLPVKERGFFAGDQLALEATILDRSTGAALWVKRIDRKVDPRDARAVKEAIDLLLAEEGWMPPAGVEVGPEQPGSEPAGEEG